MDAPYPHPACLDDEHLLAQCTAHTGRSGGPGGQNRNKVETHVELTHTPSGLSAQAGERRSQIENKRVALRRLRLTLATELRCSVPARSALSILDEPAGSALWRSRVRATKISLNPDHHDYPSMLAEALDMLAHCRWDPARAASNLDTTSSQLVKLIAEHAPALVMVNRQRQKLDMHPLRGS
jgi:hypothetical protein